MLILPYSTALTFVKPPLVTYSTVIICVIIFLMQSNPSVTQNLIYYPDSWNPLSMLSSALAHGDWMHIIGNMIFYLAFAPALEVIINNKFRYIWIMVFISLVVGVSYSLSVMIGNSAALPTLGFSGVVSGMIGLSAYLVPKARIRVFWWYVYGGKVFYVQSWVLALWFIGLDTWTMLTASSYGYINVVAHVAGGFAGYFYGHFWLKEIKQETHDELAHEMKAMDIQRSRGKLQAEAFRERHRADEQLLAKQSEIEFDRFMRQVHQLATTSRDSDAICLLLSHYDLDSDMQQLESIYKRIETWGASRTLLCFGRLIIHKLDALKRYGRAIVYIEQCQKISPLFIIADVTKARFYIKTANEMNKPTVASNLYKGMKIFSNQF